LAVQSSGFGNNALGLISEISPVVRRLVQYSLCKERLGPLPMSQLGLIVRDRETFRVS
jgi:hypothetical protein